ncbi:MAG: hypothetical protein KF708_18650 [Pirellulales bacterium]|nr:hypothetical protein [Pirellulales bacterium]
MITRVFRLLSVIFGLLGLAGCLAVVVAAWLVGARVNHIAGQAFGAVDETLVAVEQRVAQTRAQVKTLTLTAQGIEQGLKDWAQEQALARVGERFDVERQAERLEAGLDQVDAWLELAESSVQFVDRALEVGNALGMSLPRDTAGSLLDELARLRTQLGEMEKPVERIREGVSGIVDEHTRRQRVEQIVQLAARVMATLGALDAGIDRLELRLTEFETATRQARAATTWWIHAASFGMTLLVGWMAAGQGALCVLGWTGRSG